MFEPQEACAVAGADLLAETPEVMEWLLRCGKEAAGAVTWTKPLHFHISRSLHRWFLHVFTTFFLQNKKSQVYRSFSLVSMMHFGCPKCS